MPSNQLAHTSKPSNPVSRREERAQKPRSRNSRRRASEGSRTGRLNIRFLIISLLLAVVVAAGVWYANQYQGARMSASLLARADAVLHDDPQQAQRLLREYLHFRPDDLDATATLAGIQFDRATTAQDWYQTFQTQERILRDDPARDEIRRRQVDVLFRMGRFADARDHLERLLEKTPDDGDLHLWTAVAYDAQGKYAEAAGEYDRALRDPAFTTVDLCGHEWTRVTAFAAWAQLLRGRLQQSGPADALFDRMIKEHPRSAEAFLARAQYRRQYGLPEQAAADARHALRLEPDNTDALITAAGLTLSDPGSDDQTVDSMRHALAHAVDAHTESASVYELLAEYEMLGGHADRI
ncbi:MAG: tetratricopeptide repeat protein, partial [Planctomycetaceae bacterium]|nr:tetratricopeptide repeat protein [Planctomycetaceae bacterium]